MKNRQFATPMLLKGGQPAPLFPIPFSETSFTENKLQALLFEHPTLIPVAELEPAFDDLIPVCRELPTDAGPLDLLFVNSEGMLTMVETKLWRNQDARRKVVAQIIDYTKEVACWTYADLDEAIRRAPGTGGKSLIEIAQAASDEIEEATFVDSITRNLRLGRFLLLIIGDGIREDVERMVEFLQETPQLRFTLGLIEIGLFRLNRNDGEPIVIQPRIVARTKEVTRAIVEIKASIGPGDVKVSVPDEPRASNNSRRGTMTEELFLEKLKELGEPTVEFTRWVLQEAPEHDLDIIWGDAGPILKYDPQDGDDAFGFGQINKRGRFVSPSKSLGAIAKRRGLSPRLDEEFKDALAGLLDGTKKLRKRREDKPDRIDVVYGGTGRRSDGLPVELLLPKKEEFMAAIDRTVEQIKEGLDIS